MTNDTEQEELIMKKVEVKPMEAYEEIGLLHCVLAILDGMEKVDARTASHMAGTLYGMLVGIDTPGLYAAIRTLEAELLDFQEMDKTKLPAIRLLIKPLLEDAERRDREQRVDG